jgi:uncharacterized SAM-binding protein YcdF (DUF218 family)
VGSLVAVLGYSTRRSGRLHPICAGRLAVAEQAAADSDTVVLSGWARRPHHPSEAELMRAAWRGPNVTLVTDGDARTTAGNARSIAAEARRAGATQVIAVTSSWHRLRARLLLRRALGPDVELRLVSPGRRGPLPVLGRELVCLLALPFQLRSVR